MLKISPECVVVYENIKFRKEGIRSAYYKIGAGEEIVLESTGNLDTTWEQFLEGFPANEPRYGAFDVEFTNKDNMKISKLIFVYWSPEGVTIKTRMLYAQGKEAFKQNLKVGKEIIVESKNHTFESIIKAVSS